MTTAITTDKDKNVVEIIIQNLPETKTIHGKEINATIDFKYSNGEAYGETAYFPSLLSEEEMNTNIKYAKENIDNYKFKNLISTIKDKDGIEVEIEIVNLIEPFILLNQPYHTVSVLRYVDRKELEYGNRKYWQLPHLTKEEMSLEMTWIKENIDKLKF